METRAVEMYIGIGTDWGTWSTEYVDIPIDTPDDKIEEVAVAKVKEDGVVDNFVFCGVYSIPSLDDQPYEEEYPYVYDSVEECKENGDHTKSCDDDGFCIYCGHQ